MKYITCQYPGTFIFGQKEPPASKEGEVLVRIRRIGICGTDLHAYAGNQAFFTYPRILGHELAGEVEDPCGNPRFRKGDRVAIIPYLSCGNCIACRVGKTNCCASLKVYGVHIDGGMQELFSFPSSLLIPAPKLEWEEIAIIEPLCIAAHAVKRAQTSKNQRILVIGCGPIGLALVAFAKFQGARVFATDVNPQRLLVAKAMGADETLFIGGNTLEEIKGLTCDELCDVVFDATGNKLAMEAGINYMGHGGKYVLVGLYKDSLSFHHPSIHAKEASILCSRNATREDFEEVMAVLASKSFPTQDYVTHSVPFEQMIAHFESWTKPESQVIKAMVTL